MARRVCRVSPVALTLTLSQLGRTFLPVPRSDIHSAFKTQLKSHPHLVPSLVFWSPTQARCPLLQSHSDPTTMLSWTRSKSLTQRFICNNFKYMCSCNNSYKLIPCSLSSISPMAISYDSTASQPGLTLIQSRYLAFSPTRGSLMCNHICVPPTARPAQHP